MNRRPDTATTPALLRHGQAKGFEMLAGLLGTTMGIGVTFSAIYVGRLVHAARGCDACLAFVDLRGLRVVRLSAS